MNVSANMLVCGPCQTECVCKHAGFVSCVRPCLETGWFVNRVRLNVSADMLVCET